MVVFLIVESFVVQLSSVVSLVGRGLSWLVRRVVILLERIPRKQLAFVEFSEKEYPYFSLLERVVEMSFALRRGA